MRSRLVGLAFLSAWVLMEHLADHQCNANNATLFYLSEVFLNAPRDPQSPVVTYSHLIEYE